MIKAEWPFYRCDFKYSTITENVKCKSGVSDSLKLLCYTYGYKELPICREWKKRVELKK